MTSINHLRNIYKEGVLYANPKQTLLEHKRWGNAAVKSGKTYVQSLNGISVFDLTDFSYSDYLEKMDPPREAIKNIVRSRLVDGSCVWLEIDVDKVHFIDRSLLYFKWLEDIKSEMNLQFLPGLEATIIGDINYTAIKNIYLYSFLTDTYQKVNLNEIRHLSVFSKSND